MTAGRAAATEGRDGGRPVTDERGAEEESAGGDRRITGVAEVALNVRDLPRMRDFYRDVLGFELLREASHETGVEPDPDGEPTIAFLAIGPLDTPLGRHGHPQLLVLIDVRRHAFARERFAGHEPDRSTLNHLAFEIPPDSYHRHRERLEALGLEPREASFPAISARALFFQDPEENLLELVCHAPTSADPEASRCRK